MDSTRHSKRIFMLALIVVIVCASLAMVGCSKPKPKPPEPDPPAPLTQVDYQGFLQSGLDHAALFEQYGSFSMAIDVDGDKLDIKLAQIGAHYAMHVTSPTDEELDYFVYRNWRFVEGSHGIYATHSVVLYEMLFDQFVLPKFLAPTAVSFDLEAETLGFVYSVANYGIIEYNFRFENKRLMSGDYKISSQDRSMKISFVFDFSPVTIDLPQAVLNFGFSQLNSYVADINIAVRRLSQYLNNLEDGATLQMQVVDKTTRQPLGTSKVTNTAGKLIAERVTFGAASTTEYLADYMIFSIENNQVVLKDLFAEAMILGNSWFYLPDVVANYDGEMITRTSANGLYTYNFTASGRALVTSTAGNITEFDYGDDYRILVKYKEAAVSLPSLVRQQINPSTESYVFFQNFKKTVIAVLPSFNRTVFPDGYTTTVTNTTIIDEENSDVYSYIQQYGFFEDEPYLVDSFGRYVDIYYRGYVFGYLLAEEPEEGEIPSLVENATAIEPYPGYMLTPMMIAEYLLSYGDIRNYTFDTKVITTTTTITITEPDDQGTATKEFVFTSGRLMTVTLRYFDEHEILLEERVYAFEYGKPKTQLLEEIKDFFAPVDPLVAIPERLAELTLALTAYGSDPVFGQQIGYILRAHTELEASLESLTEEELVALATLFSLDGSLYAEFDRLVIRLAEFVALETDSAGYQTALDAVQQSLDAINQVYYQNKLMADPYELRSDIYYQVTYISSQVSSLTSDQIFGIAMRRLSAAGYASDEVLDQMSTDELVALKALVEGLTADDLLDAYQAYQLLSEDEEGFDEAVQAVWTELQALVDLYVQNGLLEDQATIRGQIESALDSYDVILGAPISGMDVLIGAHVTVKADIQSMDIFQLWNVYDEFVDISTISVGYEHLAEALAQLALLEPGTEYDDKLDDIESMVSVLTSFYIALGILPDPVQLSSDIMDVIIDLDALITPYIADPIFGFAALRLSGAHADAMLSLLSLSTDELIALKADIQTLSLDDLVAALQALALLTEGDEGYDEALAAARAEMLAVATGYADIGLLDDLQTAAQAYVDLLEALDLLLDEGIGEGSLIKQANAQLVASVDSHDLLSLWQQIDKLAYVQTLTESLQTEIAALEGLTVGEGDYDAQVLVIEGVVASIVTEYEAVGLIPNQTILSGTITSIKAQIPTTGEYDDLIAANQALLDSITNHTITLAVLQDVDALFASGGELDVLYTTLLNSIAEIAGYTPADDEYAPLEQAITEAKADIQAIYTTLGLITTP